MKKMFFVIIVIVIMALSLKAQNIQLHYDMGKGRGYLTSTVEMFKPDKYGSTFFFIDMNYDVGDVKGISLAYWEIARAIKFWDAPFAFHTEFNGGMGQWKKGEASGAYTIGNSYLNGIEYSWNAQDFSKGFTLQVLHKYIRGKHQASFQLTGVWYLNLFHDKFSFKGFADFWREDFVFGNKTTRFVFLSEPQFWFNFCKIFSMGSEIELGNNFGGNKGFHIMPTIGAKYIFN
jgi:hypothetical protein